MPFLGRKSSRSIAFGTPEDAMTGTCYPGVSRSFLTFWFLFLSHAHCKMVHPHVSLSPTVPGLPCK